MSPAPTAARPGRPGGRPGAGHGRPRTRSAVLDSTAHALKFSGFQDMYFENRFPADFDITPHPALMNRPSLIPRRTLPGAGARGPFGGRGVQAFRAPDGRGHRRPPESENTKMRCGMKRTCVALTLLWFSPDLRPAARPDRIKRSIPRRPRPTPHPNGSRHWPSRPQLGRSLSGGGNLIRPPCGSSRRPKG